MSAYKEAEINGVNQGTDWITWTSGSAPLSLSIFPAEEAGTFEASIKLQIIQTYSELPNEATTIRNYQDFWTEAGFYSVYDIPKNARVRLFCTEYISGNIRLILTT